MIPRIAELIETGAVTMLLQPVVDLRTGEVFGYEALARGRQGSPFFEAPALFRAAAAACLAPELEWLCRRRALEVKKTLLRPGEKIFLNFDPTVAVCPEDCLLCGWTDELGIPREEVVLEITERVRLHADARIEADVHRCRSNGFLLALDDLGAGYAGLSSLISLRPNFAKLDASLVRDIDRDARRANLIRMLMRYARITGFHLIAEGIETTEALQTILGLGIDFGQGYFLAGPAGRPDPLNPEALALIERSL